MRGETAEERMSCGRWQDQRRRSASLFVRDVPSTITRVCFLGGERERERVHYLSVG